MEDYNFWQDFFDTYQSLSNGAKALWLIMSPAFVLGHRVAVKEAETAKRGDLVYTICRDVNDQLHVYRHGAALDREPALVLLDQPRGGDGKHGFAARP
jgi:hypothetical protein